MEGPNDWYIHNSGKLFQKLIYLNWPHFALTCLSCVPAIIDDAMNAALSKEFDEKELEEALHQMAPLKAPGPDGMPLPFY